MKQNDISDLGGNPLATHEISDGNPVQLGDEIKPLIAEYSREGVDLNLSSDTGDYITIYDYFFPGNAVDLITDSGARIPADLVVKLTGPGLMAQSADTQSDADGPIGEVSELSGTVTARHADGTSEELVPGGAVFKGDVIETASGSSFTIVFGDDTQFSMGENGRAVLDEMIYNPSSGDGKFGVSLLQGVFSLVSGQIAKDDPENVDVRTPVGTIGIRGTSWSGHVKNIGEETIFTLFTGAIVITNEAGSQLLDVPNQSVFVTSFSALPSVPFILTGEQLFNIYGEALRLVNPEWFDDEDNFDPDEISPEAGRRAQTGGGANFHPFSEGGIDGGQSIGDLLRAAGLLTGTDLDFRNAQNGEEIIGIGPQTGLNVVSVVDQESGNLESFQIFITLTEPTNVPVIVTYEIRAGSASETGAGLPGDLDFISNGDGTITIPPGATEAAFTVTVIDDDVIEDLEFFIVAITGAENADIDITSGQALVVITDDDIGLVTMSEVTVDGVGVDEGDLSVGEGAGALSFTLTLDKAVAPGVTVSVNYQITGTVTAGSDYTADTVQTITFDGGEAGLAPGATTTIVIPILDDSLFEGPESLTLSLVSASSNATIDTDSASVTLTIEDNDDPVVVGEGTPAELVETEEGDVIEGASLGIGGGSGEISAVTFDASQANFDAAGLTSNGVPIVLSGLGTNVVTGAAGGVTVFTVTLNTDGTYDMSLERPIDHLGSDGENVADLSFDLALSVNDTNNSSATGTLTVEIEDSGPALGAAADIFVDEDDLPAGGDITPESTSANGVAEIDFGLDGAGSVILDISALPAITSGGDPVVYELVTLADGITQQVIATALPDGGAARPVFLLEFGPNGDGDNYGYTLTLNDVVDHSSAGEDGLALPFSYNVVDQDGSVTSGSFAATIIDDVPIASSDAVELPAPMLPAYNLVFVLDISGSMTNFVPEAGQTRIQILRAAVDNVLSEYEAVSSEIKITIIGFAAASSVVFEGTSVQAAQDFVTDTGNLVPGGATNYAAAIANDENGAQGILEADLADPTLAFDQTTVYFISDGEPSDGQAILSADEFEWQQFIESNDIEVVAVGLGSDISTDELAKVENEVDEPTVVIDPGNLGSVLVDTIPVVETDNVVSSGSIDRLGADDGTLTLIVHNGTEYAIPQNGDPLIVESDLGGSLSIDATGDYTYTAPDQADPGEVESFEYVLTDGDGDTSSAFLTFTFVDESTGGLAVSSAFAVSPNVVEESDESEQLFGTPGADVFAFTTADTGDVTIDDFDVTEDSVNLDQIFDDLGILADDRGNGEAWELGEVDGKATLSMLVANGPTIIFDNYVNPDVQALEDIASRIVVDES